MTVAGWIMAILLAAALQAESQDSGAADTAAGKPALSVRETIPADKETAPAVEKKVREPEQLDAVIKEITARLETALPEYAAKTLNAREDEIIKAFVEAAGFNLKYAGADYKSPEKLPPAKPFPMLKLSDGRIVYFRIDGFNDAVFEQLKKDCAAILEIKRKERPHGIVVDLRNCRGFDLENARKSLLLLCSGRKIKSVIQGEDVDRMLKIKLAVLVGRKTSGSAEIFADLTRASGSGIIIGERTAGQPFRYKPFKLKNGRFLLVPEVPDNFKSDSMFCGVTPLITKENGPQAAYDKAEKEPDECLKYAVNMLIALRALGKY